MSNLDVLDAPIRRAYSTKKRILALCRCQIDYGDLSLPFPARWRATIRLCSPDTPTITIRCGVYSRAFISLERGICAVFIGGWRLLEEILYLFAESDVSCYLVAEKVQMSAVCTRSYS